MYFRCLLQWHCAFISKVIIVPYRASSIEEAVEIGVRTFENVGEIINRYKKNEPAAIGNYYGWAPISNAPEIVMDLIHEAVCECGYENKAGYALDCASGEIYEEETNTYLYKGNQVAGDDIIGIAKHLKEKYNLLYIEDILAENDCNGFKKAVREISRTIIIGDDFTGHIQF